MVVSRNYSTPEADRIGGIWGSYYIIPKAIFYLLKGHSRGPLLRVPRVCSRIRRIPRYPSSTLFPFLFGGLLVKLNIRKKGTPIFKGLLGNLDSRFLCIENLLIRVNLLGCTLGPPAYSLPLVIKLSLPKGKHGLGCRVWGLGSRV